jgi:hypothetical protein
MVTDLRRLPVMGFFTVALRPGESKDGQLSRAWAPPFCDGVSFRNVLGENIRSRPDLLPMASKTAKLVEEQFYCCLSSCTGSCTADEHVGRTVGLIQE